MLTAEQQVKNVVSAIFRGMVPPPKRTVDKWADEKRYLTSVSASETGRWRTDRTPYLREIMYELSALSPCNEVAFLKGAQIGGTEVGLNWIGQTIDEDPCPMLVVQPTITTANRFSKQRVTPMVNSCPSLLEKIPKTSSKDTTNTALEKEFPGGMLIMGGGNSAAGLRSMPIKKLFLDELDNYPPDADGEGDPVELAVARTKTFSDRKIFYNSTPNEHETSRINPKFEEGDQRDYLVPCPFCGEAQTITWDKIKWYGDTLEEKMKNTRMKCQGCEELIPERYKTKMLDNGFWEAQNPNGAFPSFRLSGLYSPLGWASWSDLVKEFLSAEGDPGKLKVFTNTGLGQTWQTKGNTVEYSELMKRREDYWRDEIVPQKALIITAGVDIQSDRAEIEILAWGLKKENWQLDYVVVTGDPEKEQLWQSIDDHLLRTFKHESGAIMAIAGAFIDAGNWQDHVLKFTKKREDRRVFGSKGRGGQGVPMINRPTTSNKQGAHLYTLGVDLIKSGVFAALKYLEKGPGYCHFPMQRDQEYFLMLTAEKQVREFREGRSRLKWKKIRERNEALDLRVYNIAALEMLNVPWDRLQKIGPLTAKRLNPKKVAKKRRIIIDKGVS